MVVTIIEGGELANILARILLMFNHKINMIRRAEEDDKYKLNEIGVNLIFGEGTDINILTQPCVLQSDVVITLMDRDADNLVSCLLIRKYCNSARTITRVNKPKYMARYEQLGINIAFDSASVLSSLTGAGQVV